MMTSQSVCRADMKREGVHPRVVLNKLHFDLRNAKPAFLGVSFCKLDNGGTTEPDAQHAQKAEHSGSNACTSAVSASGDAGACNVGQPVLAVDDDDDTDRLVAESDATATPFHSYAVDNESEQTNKTCAFPPINSEHTPSDDRLLSCRVLKKEILPPSDPSIPSFTSSTTYHKQRDFSGHKNMTRKTADNAVAENKITTRSADATVVEPFSAFVKEPCTQNDTVTGAAELSGAGSQSESSLPSGVLDDLPLSERKHLRSCPSRVKKPVKSHSVRKMIATSINEEVKFKEKKPTVTQTPRRRRRIKHDSDDEAWSMEKKLLIMPVGKKFSKSLRGRKRKTRAMGDIFALAPKRKRRKLVSKKEMELPDLSTALDNCANSAADMLETSQWEPNVDENTVLATASRKWNMDITGADLSTDLDIDYQRISNISDQQNNQSTDKPADESAGQLMPQSSTDTEYHRVNFSNTQETPPPSVASGGLSLSDDEQDLALQSDMKSENSADSRWLTFDTRLAHYIDGRRFDRLVNGITVQVSATLMDEALAQIGLECVFMANLTKLDVKQLQDQVRLEEIYHRRVKKAAQSLQGCSNEKVKRRSSRRRNVSNVAPRSSLAKRTAKSCRTVAAGATAVQQQDTSFDDKLCPETAASTDNDDTVSYESSDDNRASEFNNSVHEQAGMSLLKGNTRECIHVADHNYSCIDGAKHQESTTASVIIHTTRRVAANKNRPEIQDQLCWPSSVSEQISSQSKCITSESEAVWNSQVQADFVEAISQQKVARNVNPLCKSNSFHADNNQPVAKGRQHAVMNTVATKTDKSYIDRAGSDSGEYIAAIALASLSVVTDSSCPTSVQSLTSRLEADNETALNLCRTEKLAQQDTDVAAHSKHSRKPSAPYPALQSAASKTATKASPKHSRGGSRLKDGERQSRHIIIEKHHEPTSEPVVDVVGRRSIDASKSRRPHTEKPHSTNAARHHKHIADSKEKLSKTCSVKSARNCGTGSVDKNNTENAGTAPNISPKSNGHAASDKTKHRKQHRGENRSDKKNVVEYLKRKPSAGNSPVSKHDKVDSSYHDIVCRGVKVPAARENVLPLDDTVKNLSHDDSASLLCSELPQQLLVSLPLPSSSASHSLIFSEDTDSCPHQRPASEAAVLLQSSHLNNMTTSSIPGDCPRMEMQTDHSKLVMDKTTADYQVDSNSNNLSKLQILSISATDKQCGDTNVAQIVSSNTVDTDVLLSDSSKIVPQSCSVARNDDVVHDEATISVQLPVLADRTPESPYRELEDIRSPSPMSADQLAAVCREEIRSPSPCDVESPATLFRVVETSWDVKLSSPCEIQSPDVSDDEAADDSVEERNRHCNICSHHGPVTIPLTVEEASITTHVHIV